jgi:acyl carrier protein
MREAVLLSPIHTTTLKDLMTHGERLRTLISDALRLPVDAIADDLDMAATGTWDSLSHMQLIAGIEEEFSLELTADEIVGMTSIGAIAGVLRARGIEL